MYGLVSELATLWSDAAATDEQRLEDTEDFAEAACRNMQKHIGVWKIRLVERVERCEALRAKAEKELDDLRNKLDAGIWKQLVTELQDATQLPIGIRLEALQELDAKIRKQEKQIQDMQTAIAQAMRAMGLDPADFPLGVASVAELQAEVARLRESLLERRNRALKILGEAGETIDADSESDFLKKLTAEVQGLEDRVKSLQKAAMTSAMRARELWEMLGEAPELPRDDYAKKFSSGAVPEDHINFLIASAIETSLSAWEARHAEATEELERLHRAIRAFGVREIVEPFLKQHNSVHLADRRACEAKLDEILAALRKEEAVARERLRQLYEETGLGSVAFEAFVKLLDNAESRDARKRMLAKETKRLERYLESIFSILGPLRELKALVIAAVAFEATVKAGNNRFSGNSVHFLEEEKFRRRFACRYPELLDGVIEAISSYEAREKQKFMYHGMELRLGLLQIQGKEVGLITVPGDLSSLAEVMVLCNIVEADATTYNPRQRCRTDQESPTAARVRSRSSSASVSPKRCKPRRGNSENPLPVPLPAPLGKVNSPQIPRPQGACHVAAVRVSSGIRKTNSTLIPIRRQVSMPAL